MWLHYPQEARLAPNFAVPTLPDMNLGAGASSSPKLVIVHVLLCAEYEQSSVCI
jgi:hypothetical protein